MEHRARGHALGVEDGERVVPRLAGVDHQGQVALVGQGDLGGEHVPLHRAGRVVVVVVEPALAHGHHPGLVQQVDDPVEPVAGLVGVQADRGPHHAWVRGPQRARPRPSGERPSPR